MLSFNNDVSLKTAILAGIDAHEAADEIVHGTYWDDGKGCAVGCTLNAFAKATGRSFSYDDHAVYDEILGNCGRIIAKLEDRIFEGMSNGFAKTWPARLIRSIPVGCDLSMVWPRFALWLLTDELDPFTSSRDVGALYREWCEGTKPSIERWRKAQASVASVAAADAGSYSYAASASYAASYAAADAASYAAADAAAYAASAAYAADAASYAAADAASSASAAADARQAFYRRMADKLIQILSEA